VPDLEEREDVPVEALPVVRLLVLPSVDLEVPDFALVAEPVDDEAEPDFDPEVLPDVVEPVVPEPEEAIPLVVPEVPEVRLWLPAEFIEEDDPPEAEADLDPEPEDPEDVF
jgi:hypothetical protein